MMSYDTFIFGIKPSWWPQKAKRPLALFFEGVGVHMTKGGSLPEYEHQYLQGLSGHALREAWSALVDETADAYRALDPSVRVPWAGPSMSARSAISARQMETWAHGQEVFDILGVAREERDRIRNIVVLGINTYGWDPSKCEVRTPPGPMPLVELTSPSGALWTYGEPQDGSVIRGRSGRVCTGSDSNAKYCRYPLNRGGRVREPLDAKCTMFCGRCESATATRVAL